jgi:hypothetical protein
LVIGKVYLSGVEVVATRASTLLSSSRIGVDRAALFLDHAIHVGFDVQIAYVIGLIA